MDLSAPYRGRLIVIIVVDARYILLGQVQGILVHIHRHHVAGPQHGGAYGQHSLEGKGKPGVSTDTAVSRGAHAHRRGRIIDTLNEQETQQVPQ